MRRMLAALVVFGSLSLWFVSWCTAYADFPRPLTPFELRLIVGGKIEDCQTAAADTPKGWFCNDVASFPCKTVCNACKGITRKADCIAKSCWRCGKYKNDIMVKECWRRIVYNDAKCTDLGDAGDSPCGPIWSIDCDWRDPVGLGFECICRSPQVFVETNEKCPRKNCKDKP